MLSPPSSLLMHQLMNLVLRSEYAPDICRQLPRGLRLKRQDGALLRPPGCT